MQCSIESIKTFIKTYKKAYLGCLRFFTFFLLCKMLFFT
ncbi:hypothetical protein HC081234_04760 [Helicobacter cinaedi]|nr:hypothetical protein HC081234_04760 [Helicobacter cinaedi]